MGSDLGRVLFYRNFHGFTGGHLKVWNYFNHTLASENYQPYISFTPNSVWDHTNPWQLFPQHVVEDVSNFSKDILFLAGLDWFRVPEAERGNSPVPIVNLIQGFRHADPHHPCYGFLKYPAIRICVSQEIKEAIEATGQPQGEIFVIPNGIDLEKFSQPKLNSQFPTQIHSPSQLNSQLHQTYSQSSPEDFAVLTQAPTQVLSQPDRPHQVTIVAPKQPQLGRQLKEQLQLSYPHIQTQMLDYFLPRQEFIQRLKTSQITVFFPLETEGFYLPALEGMAAGTLVVCPDCVGNRSFCLDNWNCWRPEYKLSKIFQAVEQVLAASPRERQEIRDHAQLTVAKHDLIAERRAFLKILAKVEQLWQEL
ncbi:MAG: glycosyltransferase family 4 protein [Coleofasciculaceae cyanobacterium SM2_1_6]|nr:glycosyltransferase family 4 protein [Coleofasciculaceae cyanobacterium SM2_1_6]